jgi:hypothetical protein
MSKRLHLSQVSQEEEENEAQKMVITFLTDLEADLIQFRSESIEDAFSENHADDMAVLENVEHLKKIHHEHLAQLVGIVGANFFEGGRKDQNFQKMEESMAEFNKNLLIAATPSFEFVLEMVEARYKDVLQKKHADEDPFRKTAYGKWQLLAHCTSSQFAQFKLLYEHGLIEKYGQSILDRFDRQIADIPECVDQIRSLYITNYKK